MAIKSKRGRATGPTRASLPSIKLFKPVSWYERISSSTSDYTSHVLRELGRLQLDLNDIERNDRPPNTQTVLSDILDWLSDHPGQAYARLADWRNLNLANMRSRLERDRDAKPRIEISAEITKMNNLSVRWHPAGWRQAPYDWASRNDYNLMTQRVWDAEPDFHWFYGDEPPSFAGRASNELMYVRGVGNLKPQPRESYGPYATYNRDVLDSILICAVRTAYENLVRQLEHSFTVDVLDEFDFITREEVIGDDDWSRDLPIDRVVEWSLEDASHLRKKREQQAAIQREARAREELASTDEMYGFGLESFVASLVEAASGKANGRMPASEQINKDAAKLLRSGGSKIDAGGVRRLRAHLENYMIELLPDPVRPQLPEPSAPTEAANILRFPTAGD